MATDFVDNAIQVALRETSVPKRLFAKPRKRYGDLKIEEFMRDRELQFSLGKRRRETIRRRAGALRDAAERLVSPEVAGFDVVDHSVDEPVRPERVPIGNPTQDIQASFEKEMRSRQHLATTAYQLASVSRLTELLEELKVDLVAELRFYDASHAITWAQIADALGTTTQAAQQRFADKIESAFEVHEDDRIEEVNDIDN